MRRPILALLATSALAVVGLIPLSSTGARAAPLAGTTQVSAGEASACARLGSGQVRCWGLNAQGQVGDGTTMTRTRARPVRTFQGANLTGVVEVAVGGSHACARLTNGQVRCWGFNLQGQLGDGTNTQRLRPVAVRSVSGPGNLTGVVDIDAGYLHTCATLESGQARCWGNAASFQLGHGTDVNANRPVVVRNRTNTGPLTEVTAVTTGDSHTCARLTNGQARCWGTNFYGQVGDGSGDTGQPFPSIVSDEDGSGALTGVSQIDAGASSTCTRMANGTARCWGEGVGRMGNGSNADSEIPTNVLNGNGSADLTTISQVAVGANTACARLASGQVRCWGQDQFGQLGDGPTADTELLPVAVQSSTGAVLGGVGQVSPGGRFGCTRMLNGQARCWGVNDFGQVGDGTATTPRTRAVVVRV